MNVLSHLHSILTINGEQVQQLADDDVPVEMPDMDLYETTRGKDGAMYAFGTGVRGGEVTVKLLPTSVTAKSWLRKVALIQRGASIVWEGVWEDSTLGYSTLLRGGVLKKAPPAVHPGKNVEFMFDFEECVPQYDSANFDPLPPI